MSTKLIAMGNMLMKDDGIGIEIAKQIEGELIKKGIEVIYGETDFEYSISKVKKNDYLLILDAACYGKHPGEVTMIPLHDFVSKKHGFTQHSYSLIDCLKLHYPRVSGVIFGIEISEIEFCFGLSTTMQEKLSEISNLLINKIDKVIEEIPQIEKFHK